jgi:hypothetical protein
MGVITEESANCTDMEKLTKFSVSVALRQLVDLASSSSEFDKLASYLTMTKWSPFVVEKCLDDVAQLLLFEKSSLFDDIVRIFSPILIELVQRASCIQMSPDVKHNLMCVLFGKLIIRNKGVLQ